MNEPWDEIERELREMSPTPPSPLCRERTRRVIETEFGVGRKAKARGSGIFWKRALAACAVAAAAITIFQFDVFHDRSDAAKPSRSDSSASESAIPTISTIPASTPRIGPTLKDLGFEQVNTSLYVVDAYDEGLMRFDGGRTPFRSIRYHLLDTVELKDPRSDVSVRMSRPREEIMLIPLRTH